MSLPTLYGLTSSGKIKQWSVTTNGNNITVTHGQVDGKMQTKVTTVQGKNIGKSNETTPEQQASIEAKAKWTKQKDKSYGEDINNLGGCKNPMLAMDARKNLHRINFPAKAQPKLDGVRCLARFVKGSVELSSRGGKKYSVPHHIQWELAKVFKGHEDIILDGELYIHGTPLQDIVGLVKKPKKGSENLEFHVFDIASEDLSYRKREEILKDISQLFGDSIKVVKSVTVSSELELKVIHDNYVKQGYEGVMVRNIEGVYKFDIRSADLQKYKEFFDEEFKIIDICEDKDGHGVPHCVTVDGKTFGATLKGTHRQREQLLKDRDQVIGKMATVQYQAKTNDGIPQFPVLLAVRDYE